jgi:hypothetical protein
MRVACKIVERITTRALHRIREMYTRRDEAAAINKRDGEELGRPRLEACQPLAETFGVHEDFLRVAHARGVF